jgi:chemotaxis family two-component system sensor kinase Cph1
MNPIDLSNCEREPIHIPGKIQSHGVLIAISREFKITYCSENIFDIAQVNAVTLLGTPVYFLETVVLKKMEGFISNLINIAQTDGGASA